MKIKDLELKEQPREKLKREGVNKISDLDLITILIKSGNKYKSCIDISKEILERINNLNNLVDLNINSFRDIKGLGETKILELISAIELGKRVYTKKERDIKQYTNPKIIYENIKEIFIGKKQECFYCLYLDNKAKLIEMKLLFMGTINQSLIHPRDIFREACLLSAYSIIMVHNHPSNDIEPSNADIEITNKILESSKMLGIYLQDHIIVGDNNYYSFYENGFIK